MANLVSPKVPTYLEFADIRLKITEDARNEIQKEVDALTKNELYYNIKADRIKLYFPIIERTLKKEGVPTDFKYLAVQESALISDAVSSANAVGFWQFKDFTGREVGLRIDRRVDERLNIVASTIGAAKYFKRHNFSLDNWVYTLLAHMTGLGGVQKYIDKSKIGSKKLTIDRNSHWYVKRFLSHLIAFQEASKGKHSEGLKLAESTKSGGLTLEKIAKNAGIDEIELKKYNKWLKSGEVPKDKDYTVLLPSKKKIPNLKRIENKPEKQLDIPEEENPLYPSLISSAEPGTIMLKINGIPCILARAKDDWASMAEAGGISDLQLVKYNDLILTRTPIEGEIYYLKSKKKRSATYYYTVQEGEDLWTISQKFGVKIANLAKMNRMSIIDEVKGGRVLWLRKKRPEDVAIEYRELPSMPVDETISFKEVMKEAKERPEMKIDTIKMENNIDEEILIADPKENLYLDIIKHSVVKGESLYSIAEAFDVTIADLVEWNGLSDYGLSIGQILIIHGNLGLETKPEKVENDVVDFHVVEAGDTMYGIARKYNVDVQLLLKMNQKENFDLVIGERLKVKE
ncbi:MAG: LysM peptidoglycan-binding domain-containing protein [Reichenbachiella sp.]